MRLLLKLIPLFLILSTVYSYGQEKKINEYLKIIAQGKVNEHISEIQGFIADNSDNPGAKLLEGVMMDDAFDAIENYKWIIQNHPDSEWADDAYWRFIQFYAVLGDTTKAKYELNNFRKRFPYSDWLVPATDVVYSAVRIAKHQHKHQANRATSDTTKANDQADASRSLSDEGGEGVKAYGLQIGIYSSRENAVAEQEKFLKLRMRTEILPKMVNDKQMFAVVIGHYKTKKSAKNAMIIVAKKCGCEPIIYEKK